MKALFINACMREKSRTLRLCSEYMKKYWDGKEVQEVALKESSLCPFNEQMLQQRDADISAGNLASSRYDAAREFADADEILIGAPFWDCSFPAILKVYLEHVCVNGITFGYGSDGAPIALCKAKKLIYITTVGGYMTSPNSLELYLKELCAMFGIPEMQIYKAEGLDIKENDAEAIMREALERL